MIVNNISLVASCHKLQHYMKKIKLDPCDLQQEVNSLISTKTGKRNKLFAICISLLKKVLRLITSWQKEQIICSIQLCDYMWASAIGMDISWDTRRILEGRPVVKKSNLVTLALMSVKVLTKKTEVHNFTSGTVKIRSRSSISNTPQPWW